MRFYHILHENYTFEDITGLFSAPPKKKSFRKEMDNIYVSFRRVFVEFVVLLTKIWPTNIYFSVTAKCWREGYSEGCFCPPPPFTPRKIINHIFRKILKNYANFL